MKNFFYLIFILLFISCKSEKSKQFEALTTITIDVDNFSEEIDISNFLHKSVDIIPLETTDDCLIANIGKIEYYKERFFISDHTSQTIFIFDKEGKYLKKVGRKGNGPGEYSEMGDFSVMGDSIYLQDKYVNKIIVCNYFNDEHREFSNNPEILFEEFLMFKNSCYYIANYRENKDLGYYQAFKQDINTRKLVSYVPFDRKIVDNNTQWGLSKYTSKYNDTATAIFAKNDTIYEVTDESICAKYVVHFSKRNLPDNIKEKGGIEAFDAAFKHGYIMGMNDILNSENHLFISYNDGGENRIVAFNKKNHNYKIGEWLTVNEYGNIHITHPYTTTNDGYLIFPQKVYMLTQAWKEYYSKMKYKDEDFRNRLELVVSKLKDDDNPVIFKFKINN